MNLKISNSEKQFILQFRKECYPSIYKTDPTDNILFVELVDFDICSFLLNNKTVEEEYYHFVMNNYQRYLKQIDLNLFDENALNFHKKILHIMELFQKYCFPFEHKTNQSNRKDG